MAFPDRGPASREVDAICVGQGGRRVEVAVGLCLAQGRGEVGRLVLGRVGAIARGRVEVDGRNGLGHVLQGAVVLRALGEEREAAVAGVLE